MKTIFTSKIIFGFILGILLFPSSASATITATFSQTIGSETITYINPIDTAIDRSTDTFYALLSDGTVQLYDDEGVFLSSFSTASAPGETISGIAVHPVSKNVYVASSVGEIKIYDDEGVYITSYGGATFTGSPRHVAVDSTGSYVTSNDDGAIYFFDPDHALVDTEVLAGANFIEVEGTTVYASVEGGSQVFSYTRTGTPITSVEVGYSIISLAIRANGTFAIGIQTREERNVYIFNTSGESIDAATQSDSLNSVATTEVTSSDLIIVGYESNDVGTVKAFDIAQDFIDHFIPQIPPARLSNPSGIAVASNGDIFVSDFDYHKVNVYNNAGTFLRTFGEYGSTDGKFKYPSDIALDSNGNVYVADRDNDRIQVFSNAGTYLDQWSVTEVGASYTGPSSLSVYNDRVYILGELGDEQLVQVFSLDGTPLFTFGGSGNDPGQFLNIRKVEVNSEGTVAVFDEGQGIYTVHNFTADGVFIDSIEEYDDAGVASLPSISGITFDANENFFFTYSSGRNVFILNKEEILIGTPEYSDEQGNLFNSPGAIAVSPTKIFIGDTGNSGLIIVFTYVDDVVYEEEQEETRRIIGSGSAASKRTQVKQQEECIDGPFLQNLRRGDSLPEVRRVQDFLRGQGVYTAPTTGFFGPITQEGIRRFQKLYSSEILAPIGLSQPTGNWYQMTRAKANKIKSCVMP